jgi:hypothetical protein
MSVAKQIVVGNTSFWVSTQKRTGVRMARRTKRGEVVAASVKLTDLKMQLENIDRRGRRR